MSSLEVGGAEDVYRNWHPSVPENPQPVESQPEAIQTEVTADELLQNVAGGWDEKVALQGVTKESAQKLLKDVYQMFDDEYEKRDTVDNSAKLDNLEKLIHLLRAKKTESTAAILEGSSESSIPVEATPESRVEVAAEVSAEQPSESTEKPKDNLIDRAAEFRLRTEINNTLTEATKLGVEMFGQYSALTQGDKILPEARRAIDAVRKMIDFKKIDKAMRSDMIKSFEVLSSGIYNQKQEQKAKQPKGYNDLLIAFDEVKNFISELKESGTQSEEILDQAKVA